MAGPLDGSAYGEEFPPAKRPRASTSMDMAFPQPARKSPSQVPAPLLIDIVESDLPGQSNWGSTASASPRGVLPSPSSAVTPQTGRDVEKTKDNVPSARPPTAKIKMKRTGTGGLPPGFVAAEQTSLHGQSRADMQPSVDEVDPSGRRSSNMDVLPLTGSSPITERRPSIPPILPQPPTAGVSTPPVSPAPAPEIPKPASAASIAMKRKWESGVMKDAIKKATATKQMKAQRRQWGDASSSIDSMHIPLPLGWKDSGYTSSLSGRLYNMWPDEKGRYIEAYGALFPDGYVENSDGVHRWVCPIVNCSQGRTYLKSHGKHFQNDHRNLLLNDNGDGTFSIQGFHEGVRPIVVTRNHVAGLDENAMELDVKMHLTAPSGRLYTNFPGTLAHTFQVPIPDGYECDESNPDKPWVCPIRLCKASTGSLQGLGNHFSRMHCGMLLRDNLDGTFSEIRAKRDDPRFNKVRRAESNAAIVAVQKPLEPGEEEKTAWDTAPIVPTTSPQRDTISSNKTPIAIIDPRRAAKDEVESRWREEKDREQMERKRKERELAEAERQEASRDPQHLSLPTDSQPLVQLQGSAMEIWEHIRPHLKNFTECPDSSWIPDLIKLPKERDIVWDQRYLEQNGGFSDNISRDVATMVVQVTGEVPHKACSRCREGNKGPYAECVVISANAPIEARSRLLSCANCTYHGQATHCSLKFWGNRRAKEAAKALEPAQQADESGPDTAQSSSLSPLPSNSTRDTADAPSPIRRSDRVQMKATSLCSTSRATDNEESSDEEDQEQEQTHTRVTSASATQAEQIQRTDNMQIEEWEVAPGRWRSKLSKPSEPVDNIAYSKYFLASNPNVRVAADASFRIEVLNPGSPLRFSASADKLRICSVGAGKVRVLIEGDDQFDIGPHGMFRVLHGKSCVVLNNFYGDAVVHVTEISD